MERYTVLALLVPQCNEHEHAPSMPYCHRIRIAALSVLLVSNCRRTSVMLV